MPGGRRRRIQVHLDLRAPLPRRVLAHLGQRRLPRRAGEHDEAGPPRLGHLQPAAQGQPPGQGGRAGGHARPPHRGSLRVRHRSWRRQPRGHRVPRRAARHRRQRDQGDLGGGDRRVPEDVDAGDLRGLPRQVLVDAAAQGPAQAVEEAAPADVVRRRATRRASRWRRARASASSASPSTTSTSPRRPSGRTRRAIADAEPVGAFVNDNILVAGGVAFIDEDRDQARRDALAGGINYHISQVFRYHDTFPRPEGIPRVAGGAAAVHRRGARRDARHRRGDRRRSRRRARPVPPLGSGRRRSDPVAARHEDQGSRRWR